MKKFQLKVSIIGISKLYRVIEVSENSTFDDLHHAIFAFFNRDDPHLYSFFITKSDSKNIRSISKAPEITHPENSEDLIGFGGRKKSASQTKIGSVGLTEKDVFHYLFDFGDEWWHRIRVEKIIDSKAAGQRARLLKAVGESPPQYPGEDDYFADE